MLNEAALPGALAGAMAGAASRAAEAAGAAEEGGGVRDGAGSGAAAGGAGGAARPCPPCTPPPPWRDCASCLASASAPLSTPPAARAREAGVAREEVRDEAREAAGVARPPGAAAAAWRAKVKRRQAASA